MSRKALKGGQFERDFCKQLSLWWTEDSGQRDDVFYRTAGSGARARVRAKQHKITEGQHGDIAASIEIGRPFVELFTVELKRGYSDSSCFSVLDKSHKKGAKTSGVQVWEDWYQQATSAAQQAGTPWWMLVTRRDGRRGFVFVPEGCDWCLQLHSRLQDSPTVRFQFLQNGESHGVFGFLLDDFFDQLTPDIFLKIHREWKDSGFLKGG